MKGSSEGEESMDEDVFEDQWIEMMIFNFLPFNLLTVMVFIFSFDFQLI